MAGSSLHSALHHKYDPAPEIDGNNHDGNDFLPGLPFPSSDAFIFHRLTIQGAVVAHLAAYKKHGTHAHLNNI